MDKFSLPEQYRKYYKSLEPILAKPKTKAYSTVIFIFLVIALFGWYAIKPTIQTIFYLRREIVDKTEVNKKMDDKINALIEAQSALEKIQDSLPTLSQSVPVNPDAVDIARQLKELATIHSASISALQIASLPILIASKSGSIQLMGVKHTVFPVTLTLDGTYQGLSSFLTDIINMRRILTIDSIAFSPKRLTDGVGGTNTLQVIIKLSSLYTGQ